MGFVANLLDKIALVYFIVHIPTTVLLDAQTVLPREWFPSAVVNMIDDYVKTLQDPFLADPPLWFKSFIYCELIFQLPLFFVAIAGYWTRSNWVRAPVLVYGAHVATTLVPILAELWFHPTLPEYNRNVLMAIYAPYFLIPALLVLRMWASPQPFGAAAAKQKTN